MEYENRDHLLPQYSLNDGSGKATASIKGQHNATLHLRMLKANKTLAFQFFHVLPFASRVSTLPSSLTRWRLQSFSTVKSAELIRPARLGSRQASGSCATSVSGQEIVIFRPICSFGLDEWKFLHLFLSSSFSWLALIFGRKQAS